LNQEASPRTQILIFLGVTAVLTAIMHLFLIRTIGTSNTIWTLLLMWIPGLVGLACSKTFGHNYRDLGLAIPRWKYFAWAYAVPAAAAALILLILIITGVGEFQFAWNKPTMNRLVFAPTLGILVATLAATGEEIGWRGFLHSRLQEVEIEHPYLFTGFIWAVWHWPLILFSDYATSSSPMISLVFFTIMIVSFSYFLGQLRQASRSVWPVALAHGVHNTWIQGIYPHFIKAGALDPFFGGESGVILAILYLSFAIYLQRKPIS